MPSFAGFFRPSDHSTPQAPNQERKYNADIFEEVGEDQKGIRRVPTSNKHKFYLSAGIVMALLLVFTSVYLSLTRTSWQGSAKTPVSGSAISTQNSYVFASPITAIADGVSVIRITVFILNGNGLGVSNTEVVLKSTGNLQVGKTQSVTDSFGRAIFDLTSTIPGSYTINAETQGLVLPQTVSISFQ